jgi:glycosyltransferase involved in cell wall biosynthesis
MERKHILIFTNHFFPENFRVNDIAFSLAEKGDDVTVFTGLPNYPGGKIFKGYGILKKSVEVVKGVKVYRIPLIPRGSGNNVRLILNYSSYLLFLTIWSMIHVFFKKYDNILVHHTSPIFLAIPAIWVKKIQRIKLNFWNLDLWPESVAAASSVKNKFLIAKIDKLVKYIYKESDKILISSLGFKQSLIKKGVKEEKIIYFPNWAEDLFTCNNEDSLSASMNRNLKIMYAGNIGYAQDIENLFEAILEVNRSSQNVEWHFFGSGRKLSWLKAKIKQHEFEDIVFTWGFHPAGEIPALIKDADAMIVSLRNEEIFAYTVPARIQAYMASGKPIMGMLNGEGARIIEEAECGYTVPAGDYAELARKILLFSSLSSEEKCLMGERSLNYYQLNFTKSKAIEKLNSVMLEI